MLVVSRQKGEAMVIDEQIEITIVEIRAYKVRLGIECPMHLPVHRKEVRDAIRQENARTATDVASIPAMPERVANWSASPGPRSTTADASRLTIDRQRPLESLKGHLRTILGETEFVRIRPLLDQLVETSGIAVR